MKEALTVKVRTIRRFKKIKLIGIAGEILLKHAQLKIAEVHFIFSK